MNKELWNKYNAQMGLSLTDFNKLIKEVKRDVIKEIIDFIELKQSKISFKLCSYEWWEKQFDSVLLPLKTKLNKMLKRLLAGETK